MNKPITTYRLIKNKKATSTFVEIMVFTALILFLAAGILWAVVPGLRNSGKVVNSKFQCSGLIGKGECKASCDATEQSFENTLGCPPKENSSLTFCCISLENTPAEPDATSTPTGQT